MASTSPISSGSRAGHRGREVRWWQPEWQPQRYAFVARDGALRRIFPRRGGTFRGSVRTHNAGVAGSSPAPATYQTTTWAPRVQVVLIFGTGRGTNIRIEDLIRRVDELIAMGRFGIDNPHLKSSTSGYVHEANYSSSVRPLCHFSTGTSDRLPRIRPSAEPRWPAPLSRPSTADWVFCRRSEANSRVAG
jgi:hypothetical protein